MLNVRNFLRTFIFRPMPWDHPNFSGSNPAFDLAGARQQAQANLGGTAEPAYSQEVTRLLINSLINSTNSPIWDIDNDNDGVPDSIWIDPGLPVVTRPDGRRYKRLVAICIKDLDGRINLNAHGNGSQVATVGPDYVYRSEYDVPYGAPPANFGLVGAVSGTSANIPRGIGFGPAEVDFLHVLTTSTPAYSDPAAVTAYTNLLQARYASNVGGDVGGTAAPGTPLLREPLSFVKHHGVPNNYAAQFSWYASPPDVWGRGAIALDYGGQPRTTGMGMNGEITDSPYELSLSGQENNADSPYTLVELERMLRYHDADVASIPSRPLILAGTQLAASTPGVIGPDEALRNLFTTHSSYIPSPASAVPREARGVASASLGATLLDIYYQRIYNTLVAGGMTPANATTQTLYEIRKMAPWELTHGQKLDLNRWLGDGFDSNGDGTPDDYVEAIAPESAWTLPGAPANFTTPAVAGQHTNGFDMNGTGVADPGDNLFARQLYAQHLYCLAMQLVPGSLQQPPITPSFDPQIPHDPSLGLPAQRRYLTIRRLAQWAINCVEFRDADSIMTPFEYDTNPTNGWQVDGNPATDGSSAALQSEFGTPLPGRSPMCKRPSAPWCGAWSIPIC